MTDLQWIPDTINIGDIALWDHNPKQMTRKAAQRLLDNWDDLGQWQTLAIGPDGECYDGHQRVQALLTVHGPDYEVNVLRASRPLEDDERARIIAEGHYTAVGHINWDELAGWDDDWLADVGFDEELLTQWNEDAHNLRLMMDAEAGPPDFSPVDEDEQPRLDQKSPITCPHCGGEFIPE
jgi:hypothetical protein